MTKNKIFALGFFDGVHWGHQALLAQCRRLAQKQKAQAAAITFDRHPQALFSQNPPLLLNSNADRTALLAAFGMEWVHTFPVTDEVMSTSWRAFLTHLQAEGAVGFVCGADFRFGRGGEGNAEKLADFCRERGLPWAIVPEQTLDGVRISSTHIRQLVEAGDMEEAARFLGRPHSLSGYVMPGRQIGRTIGVPTANILIPEEVVVPKLGVYTTECLVDGVRHKAVTNIGSRPTVEGHQVRAESWLLDFEGDLYGKHMTVFFHKFLRPEQKFDTLDKLKEQILQDAEDARRVINGTY